MYDMHVQHVLLTNEKLILIKFLSDCDILLFITSVTDVDFAVQIVGIKGSGCE